MAKVELNPLIKGVHGRLGDMVFRRTPSGEVTLIKLADMSKVEWSPAQQAQRKKFKAAIAYAKEAMADKQAHAYYEATARQQNKQPFRVAVSDYFKGKDQLTGR